MTTHPHPSPAAAPRHVLIAGGGIGGLTLACAVRQPSGKVLSRLDPIPALLDATSEEHLLRTDIHPCRFERPLHIPLPPRQPDSLAKSASEHSSS